MASQEGLRQWFEAFPSLVRSGISKHLMALRQANLVYATRQGREQHYRINPRAMRELLRPF